MRETSVVVTGALILLTLAACTHPAPTPPVASPATNVAGPTLPIGRGSLDALMLPRRGRSRIAHYSSADPTGGNEDFRRIAPGETLTLLDHTGAGVVRRWWITIAPRDNREIQRQLVVRCWWDDESTPSVEAPVSDFFGVGFGEWHAYASLPTNMTSGGYDTYWPMPFRRHARITVENRSPVTVESFYYDIDVETADALPDSALYFHAQFRRAATVRGEPVVILEATGRGHYVGTVLSMQPRRNRSLWFLEGDERVFVDGEMTPSIVGTGTEDYLSAGWYFDTGPYSAPYHGLTVKDTLSGRVSAYRWHIEDPIPFARSLRFTIEHGGTNDTRDVDYSSVAYWYQTHPHAPFPPLPTALAPASPYRPLRVAGMIEAEELLVRAHVTAGRLRTQDMTQWDDVPRTGGQLVTATSAGAQLWWVEAGPGARLSLPLRAPVAGDYELVGYFTHAADYGDVRLRVNGRALQTIVRGYSPTVVPAVPTSFGRVHLRAGVNTIEAEITGKDPRSQGYSDGYLVGIDGFMLRAR